MKPVIRIEVRLEGSVNVEIQFVYINPLPGDKASIDSQRFYSCDESLRYGDGDKADCFVHDHDSVLSCLLQFLVDQTQEITTNYYQFDEDNDTLEIVYDHNWKVTECKMTPIAPLEFSDDENVGVDGLYDDPPNT